MKFVTAPVASANPNERAPLSAIVAFTTDTPSRAVLEVSEGERRWTVDSVEQRRTRHSVPVIGLRPGRDHAIVVTAQDGEGNRAVETLGFTAPELADDFPLLKVMSCIPERREPGVMVFNIRHSPASEHLPGFGLLVGIDRWGEIVWTYRIDEAIGDVRRLANGNLLYVADGRVREIDLLGDTRAEWYAKGRWEDRTPQAGAREVAAGMFHHAAIELPWGNLLACSMEIREIDGFPATEDDPEGGTETARLVGDVIVEFARDGTVVNEYRLLDLLDPRRVCYGSRSAYWVRRGFPGTCDWSHVNALAYDGADDGFVASVRHQDCLIKIDRASGELVWILGDHAGWRAPWTDKLLTAAPGLEWPYHQHDCSITPAGTLLCFDNGNHRAIPFAPGMPEVDCYSRAVEFAVDRDGMTARQIWARGRADDGTYSCFQSGAYRLPSTGNTYINYGGVCSVDGTPSDRLDEGHCKLRQIETAKASPDEIVFELTVDDDSAENAVAYSSFRAEHFPQLGDLDA